MNARPGPAAGDQATAGPADLGSLVDRVPVGWSAVTYRGRRWGLRRTDHAGGRTVAIQAEELGGNGWVSTNVLRLSCGPVLKPCEMPVEHVLHFLGAWTAQPDGSAQPDTTAVGPHVNAGAAARPTAPAADR